ncbi:MAG: alpha/beta hydrolase [Chloroflexota bacterium]
MRRSTLLAVLLLVFALTTRISVFAQSANWLDSLDTSDCPNDSQFTCVTISVPLDHFDKTNTETIDVVFAVLPAEGASKGLFVTSTGGPGSAGIGYADDYTSYFSDSVRENFDIVFFDQRGIGMSGGLDCPNAVAAYFLDSSRPLTPEGETATLAAAQIFAHDCQSEMGSPELLSYISTEQAVHDLEAFRQAAGDPMIWLYGESYGTQYAQTYAAAFPENVAGLILDGVVDLTLEGTDFYVEEAQAFSDVLTRSLEACNADAACAADFGTDAVAFYDDMAAELLSAPAVVNYPLADGTSEERAFTVAMLETDAASAVYGRGGRADFLRELAAAAHNDLLPLMRDFYVNAGVDPFTFEPIVDPTYFSSMYYGVECGDYNYFSGTGDERGSAFMEAGNPVEAAIPRLSIIYYTDLPCIYWDSTVPPTERPASLPVGDYVTFILNSSTDPATPTGNGYAVYDRLIADGGEAYMITMEGGPHVLFGRDDTCPDVAVTDWMVDGILPESHEYVCPGDVIADYTPLNSSSFADYASPLDAIQAVDEEIQYLPEYFAWDVASNLTVGCTYGGSVTFSPTDDGEAFALDECAFIEGFALNGTATYDYGVALTFDVEVNGSEDDYLVYTNDLATGMYTIKGELEGQAIRTPRLFY